MELKMEAPTYHNIGVMLIEETILLPTQFFTCSNESGELALMRAVIDNAINDLVNVSKSNPRRTKRLQQEARAYFLSTNSTWLYSFESICHAFRVDPSYVRKHLFARVEQIQEAKSQHVAGVHKQAGKVNLPFRVGDFWSEPGKAHYTWFATEEEAGEFYQQAKQQATTEVA